MQDLNINTKDQKRTILKNISWLTISRIVVSLLSIITITVIPRYLGVTGYGQLNFALSFVGIFAILGHLGVSLLTLRDVSKNNKLANKYFNNLFSLQLFLSFILLIIVAIISFFLNKDIVVKQLLLLITFTVIFHILTSLPRQIFQAFQKLKFVAIYEIIRKVFYVIFMFLFIYLDLGVLGIGFAQVFMSFIGLLFIFFNFRKFVDIKLEIDLPFIKSSFLKALPFAFSTIFSTIYFHFDRILISFIKGEYFVGLYAIGYSLFGFLVSFLEIFNHTFFPVISKYLNTNKLRSIVNRILYIVLFFSVPLTFGGIYLSKGLISLIFGSAFIEGSTAFSIILIFFLVYSFNLVFNMVLFNSNFEKYVLKLRIIATISNIILNILIIPYFGIVGAAITTVFSEYIILVGSYLKLSRKVVRLDLLNILKIPLISSIIMIFVIYVFKNIFNIIIFTSKFNILVFVVIGAISYFISSLILGGIKKEYYQLLLNFITQNKK
jgi:O-antigen/teichoic acid export membrane protein